MTTSGIKRFLASYRIADCPHAGLKLLPWIVAPCDGVLINAYDFMKNRRTLRFAKKLLEQSAPLSSLKLPKHIILDSGAYYFVRSDTADIDPAQIIELAVTLGVPHVVTLDHPFAPGQTTQEVNRRIDTTAANTASMAAALNARCEPVPSLIPALHGHDEKTLLKSYNSQPHICDPNTTQVGLGSLAPLAQRGAIRHAAAAIMKAREILEDKHMHVFSVGSPLLMHFAFLCGADSVDSQSWMMSAAFKQAHLPGLTQLRLSTKERERLADVYDARRQLFEQQLLKLQFEEGFEVKNWETGAIMCLRDEQDAREYTDLLEDGSQGNRVHWRACHNLAVGTFEARRMTSVLDSGAVTTFLMSRHKSGPYRAAMIEVIDTLDKKGLLCKEHRPRCSDKPE